MTLAHQLVVDPNAPNVPVELPISNAAIEHLVFTHSSFNGSPTASLEHEPATAVNNRSLALRGDAILREMITAMLLQRYPGLTTGMLTRILSAVLSNDTFARICVRFGFHHRILAAGHQTHIIQNGIVAQATVFEAYIGGLIAAGTARQDVNDFVEAIFSALLYHEYTWVNAQAAAAAPIAAAPTHAVAAEYGQN